MHFGRNATIALLAVTSVLILGVATTALWKTGKWLLDREMVEQYCDTVMEYYVLRHGKQYSANVKIGHSPGGKSVCDAKNWRLQRQQLTTFEVNASDVGEINRLIEARVKQYLATYPAPDPNLAPRSTTAVVESSSKP